MKCTELAAMESELDEQQRRLVESSNGSDQELLQKRIAALVQRIQAHREKHADCDFKPRIQ